MCIIVYKRLAKPLRPLKRAPPIYIKQKICYNIFDLIKRDGGTSPMKSHQPIKLGGNASAIR